MRLNVSCIVLGLAAASGVVGAPVGYDFHEAPVSEPLQRRGLISWVFKGGLKNWIKGIPPWIGTWTNFTKVVVPLTAGGVLASPFQYNQGRFDQKKWDEEQAAKVTANTEREEYEAKRKAEIEAAAKANGDGEEAESGSDGNTQAAGNTQPQGQQQTEGTRLSPASAVPQNRPQNRPQNENYLPPTQPNENGRPNRQEAAPYDDSAQDAPLQDTEPSDTSVEETGQEEQPSDPLGEGTGQEGPPSSEDTNSEELAAPQVAAEEESPVNQGQLVNSDNNAESDETGFDLSDDRSIRELLMDSSSGDAALDETAI